jgi:hypothetical protein
LVHNPYNNCLCAVCLSSRAARPSITLFQFANSLPRTDCSAVRRDVFKLAAFERGACQCLRHEPELINIRLRIGDELGNDRRQVLCRCEAFGAIRRNENNVKAVISKPIPPFLRCRHSKSGDFFENWKRRI